MTRWIEIDDEILRGDRVQGAAEVLRKGGLLAMPSDTTWIVACDAMQTEAVKRLQALRAQMGGATSADDPKPMSLMCPDLKSVGTFALVDQPLFRTLRRCLPGPYTFILEASRQVPRLLQEKRRAIGIRIPDHPVALAILQAFDGPLFVASCQSREGGLLDASPAVDAEWGHQIDAIIESRPIEIAESTIVDWTKGYGVVIRIGKGEPEAEWELP